LNTTSAEGLPASSIAFPIRLRQGLLERSDEREVYLTLVAVMARTPCGSWPGHASFGFNELFSEITKYGLTPEARARILLAAVQKINSVLADLGLTRYQLESLVPDASETDPQQNSGRQWRGHEMERRGVTAILRESGSSRAIEYAL
jgi:hypothetical protein